jgi:polygalacturonase
MIFDRRSMVFGGGAGLSAITGAQHVQAADRNPGMADECAGWFDIRQFGAKGDGVTIDSPAINKAIDAAAANGGGVVHVPAGTYACYTIRLKSFVELRLGNGATILAAPTPLEGMASGGYDRAEPQGPWEPYQDYGHNHWRNSLIHGDALNHIAITGAGLIHGKGLSRGHGSDADLPDSTKPGVGNKAIALKNCRNVLIRDIQVLQGGWFALLATGVDTLTIDNVVVDTNRDGFDIDCCRNVRITNCTVNSPWDDGICPKSSYALGYPRMTENLTIANCMVTGNYVMGSVIDGTWRKMPPSFAKYATGRIKCGTESNGGFRNVAITNCVFDDSRGLCLETVDGATCEDITISNITMRGSMNSPIFLRLGRRMRGPAGTPVGTLRRILIDTVTSYDAAPLPSIIAGVAGHPVEDIKVANVFLHQRGGGSAALAGREPPVEEDGYPEPTMFGDLPATGFFIRHARNVEMSNIEIAVAAADARPALWMQDVDEADFFRLRLPGGPSFALDRVSRFRSFGSRGLADARFDEPVTRTI